MNSKFASIFVLTCCMLAACGTTQPSATSPGNDGVKDGATVQTAPQNPNQADTKPIDNTPANADQLEPLALISQITRQCGGEILFDFDSFAVGSSALPVVECHAQALLQHGKLALQLTGHTDEQGSQEYNMALGNRRAQAVLKLLQHQGIEAERLEAISMGELQPVAEGHDEAAYRQNRRVVFNYQAR